jgi:hypothetical protein
MELQEIEVTIDQEGKVYIQVRGVKGTACLDITRELEEALGGQIELREMTPEALEVITEQIQQLQQGPG